MNIKERAVKALNCLKDKLLKKTGLKKLETKVSPKKFSCDHCNKTFAKRLKLKIHKRKHTGEKLYSCDFCDYKCKTSGNLKQHKQNKHTNDKPYRCELCDYKCKTKGQLKNHSQNNHTGEKFSCSKCSKSFASKYNLKYHDRVHSEKKPFSCQHCEKTFRRASHLKTHEKLHTGDKPFSCSKCSKSFTCKYYLKSHHEKLHTFQKSESKISLAKHGKNELNDLISVRKIDIFSCSKCDKKFALKFALLKHEAKHSAITYKGLPFGCQHCDKTFTDPDSWQRHERLMVRGGKRLCGK